MVLTIAPIGPYYNFEKWIVQLLVNKYFVLVFIAYFLLLFCFCFCFFIQSKTLIPPNPWICSAARHRTNIEPKRIHPHKMDISLLKTAEQLFTVCTEILITWTRKHIGIVQYDEHELKRTTLWTVHEQWLSTFQCICWCLWLYDLLICLARTVYTRAFKYTVILSVMVSGECGFLELANKSTLYNTMNLRF